MERIDMIQAAQMVQPAKSSQATERKDTGFTQLLRQKAEDGTGKAGNIGKRPVQKDKAKESDQESDQLEETAVLAQGISVWGMSAQLLSGAVLKLGNVSGGQDQLGTGPLGINTVLETQETGVQDAADQGTVMEVMQQHTEIEETAGKGQTAVDSQGMEIIQEQPVLSEDLLQTVVAEPEVEAVSNDSKTVGISEAVTMVQNAETGQDQQQAVSVRNAVSAEKKQEQQESADTSQNEGAQIAAQNELPVTYRTYSTAGNTSSETVQVKTEPETLPADVGEALASRLPQKDGQLTIELEPASLGKITVKVMYEAGRAEVSIMANNPKTLELLSKNAGDIAGILQEKTGQETVVYTAQPQPQSGEEQASTDSKGQRQDRQEPKERKDRQQDSFAQQLRLGLV